MAIKESIESIAGVYLAREEDIEEENIRRFWLNHAEVLDKVVPTKEETAELAGAKEGTLVVKGVTEVTKVTEEFL